MGQSARELGPVLIDVLLGGRSSRYAQKAKELAELCTEFGGGRVRAARYILAEVKNWPDADVDGGS
jgi:hypothetical protein